VADHIVKKRFWKAAAEGWRIASKAHRPARQEIWSDVTTNKAPGKEDSPKPHDHAFGGQAVIEGVMMRGRHSWGVAVRRPSGDIARVAYALPPAGSRNRFWRLPVLRGMAALYDSLSLGIKALGLSANISLEGLLEAEAATAPAAAVPAGAATTPTPAAAATTALSAAAATTAAPAGAIVPEKDEDAPVTERRPSKVVEVDEQPPAFGWKQLTVTVIVAVGMAVALFVVVPLVVVKHFEDTFSNPIVFNIVEGVIRLVIFVLYLAAVSLIPDLRRVFEYHGAEHKVIHAYEASGRPDPVLAQKFSTRHPRCGTGFLLLVFVIAVFLFAVIGKPSVPLLVLSRIIGIPIIVGIGYEIGIKWAGRSKRLWARILLWPGIQLQRLTTREPSPEQLEVAAAALEDVIEMDRAEIASQKEELALT
jgi:uncharacterized protein YqhQ